MKLMHRHYGEDDSLQADVMRFMAIVAFCLIAILAMVRQTSPADLSPSPQAEPAPAVASVPEPVPEPVLKPEPAAAPEPKPKPEPEPEPIIAATMTSTPAARVDAEGIGKQPVSTPPARKADEDQGLTLRFASDRDFLRLVGRGKVNVYAYDADRFLALDRSHHFHQAKPPAQVYELELATIPSHLRQALPGGLRAERLTWAVGLTRKVQQQIQQHLTRVDSGELRINRYEEVHHVPQG